MRLASALQLVDLGLFSGHSSRGSASACLALGAAPAVSARSSSGETPTWSAEVRLAGAPGLIFDQSGGNICKSSL